VTIADTGRAHLRGHHHLRGRRAAFRRNRGRLVPFAASTIGVDCRADPVRSVVGASAPSREGPDEAQAASVVLDVDPHAGAIAWPGRPVTSVTQPIGLEPFEDPSGCCSRGCTAFSAAPPGRVRARAERADGQSGGLPRRGQRTQSPPEVHRGSAAAGSARPRRPEVPRGRPGPTEPWRRIRGSGRRG
jgi:hypothetical protein